MTATIATTRQVIDRLRSHYLTAPRTARPAQLSTEDVLTGAVLLTEVPAPYSGRRADAIVIGLTRARAGLDGFEVKVTRSDWLRELEQPVKADSWYPHVHRWWVAAPAEGIVCEDELPPGWGLMIPDRRSTKRMKVLAKPTTREPEITWPVLCELAKKMDRQRATDVVSEVGKLNDALRQQAVAAAEAQFNLRHDDEQRIGHSLIEVTGLAPHQLRYLLDVDFLTDHVRQAVRAVFAAGTDTTIYGAEQAEATIKRIAEQHHAAAARFTAAWDALHGLKSTCDQATVSSADARVGIEVSPAWPQQ